MRPVYFHTPNWYLSVFHTPKNTSISVITERMIRICWHWRRWIQNLYSTARKKSEYFSHCVQSVREYLLQITVEWTWTIAWWSSSTILIWWQLSGCIFIHSCQNYKLNKQQILVWFIINANNVQIVWHTTIYYPFSVELMVFTTTTTTTISFKAWNFPFFLFPSNPEKHQE